jgi:hypothetical protein
VLLLCSDEKKIGLEQTEQKHLKKQKRVASRDQERPVARNNKQNEIGRKICLTRTLIQRTSETYKKGRKAARVWEKKLSPSHSRTNLSFKKRARAKSGESVFLIVGKYHLWDLTLTRTLVVVKEKEIAPVVRAHFLRGERRGRFSLQVSFFPQNIVSSWLRFGFGRR